MLYRSHVSVFAFSLIKIVTQGQLSQQLVRPVVRTCFRFFACENWNVGAAVPVAGMAAVVAFLSNTSLAIFAFSIADVGVAAGAVSSWLYVPVFAFPLIKIVIRGQQLQMCQAGCTYLFLLSTYKNCNVGAAVAGVSKRSHIPVYAFHL